MASTSSLDMNPIEDNRIYFADVNGYRVPQNVRHRFRSVITDELLADKSKVERDKNETHYADIKYVPSTIHRPKTAVVAVDPNPDYTRISNDLRSSICHGYPVSHCGSHTKTVHNAHLFKEHFEAVALEKKKQIHSFGRKKDWLGRWTEANLVRARLTKDFLDAQKKTTIGSAST